MELSAGMCVSYGVRSRSTTLGSGKMPGLQVVAGYDIRSMPTTMYFGVDNRGLLGLR